MIKVKYSGEPTLYEHKNGDWCDIATSETVSMKAGEFKLISLGVAMQLPDGYEAYVIPRSSTFKNYGILQSNSFGLIDNSYCGNNDIWKFPCYATRDIEIPKGSRICQFRIQKKMKPLAFIVVDQLDSNDRGGFGSTGV